MGNLKQEIENLIALEQEGDYWDFKREWYDKQHLPNLLHDIISMANNLANRDCYIIIGVDEENDFDFKDVLGDPNRKNTQKLVDFLKNKKFAGDMRPIVHVETIEYARSCIDIIVIKNSNKTPFYLKEAYKGVFANQIYTRIQDTNTPLNSSADIDKIEWLWKKRFGLIQTPIERIESFLEEPNAWVNGPNGEMQKYYKRFPEYTLVYDDAADGRDGYTYYLFSQYKSRPYWKDIKVYYHQTLLIEVDGVALNGGVYMTPCPDIDGICFNEYYSWDIPYRYMVKGSFKYKLSEFLYHNEWSYEAKIARDNFFSVILIFETELEKDSFIDYVICNWEERDKYKDSIHIASIPEMKGYNVNVFKKEYENALILKLMLHDFRRERGLS